MCSTLQEHPHDILHDYTNTLILFQIIRVVILQVLGFVIYIPCKVINIFPYHIFFRIWICPFRFGSTLNIKCHISSNINMIFAFEPMFQISVIIFNQVFFLDLLVTYYEDFLNELPHKYLLFFS